MMMEVRTPEKSHKYLGQNIDLFAELNTTCELNHRLQIAWGKFHQHRRWLLDPHISLFLKLRFFDAIISPTALFGRAVLSHIKEETSKMDVAQRKILRNILG